MQSYHVMAACAGYTRKAVTSKALTLISGSYDNFRVLRIYSMISKDQKQIIICTIDGCGLPTAQSHPSDKLTYLL